MNQTDCATLFMSLHFTADHFLRRRTACVMTYIGLLRFLATGELQYATLSALPTETG